MQQGYDSVVCPKPRRVGHLNLSVHDQIRPLRWPSCSYNQSEMVDSEAGSDLLDMILTKGGYGNESPYFCGSPPSRAANPLIQDAQFNSELSPTPPSASSRIGGGGYVRMKFGHKPAMVRIEGFEMDRRSCSVSAVA